MLKPVIEMFTAEQYRTCEKKVQLEAARRPDKKGHLWRQKKLMRYWCFRFRNEATGGCAADDPTKGENQRPPTGLKKKMENTPGFTSWEGFADLWDLHPAKPSVIVHRSVSVWHEHEARMRAVVPVLPLITHGDSRGERVVKRAAQQLMAVQSEDGSE